MSCGYPTTAASATFGCATSAFLAGQMRTVFGDHKRVVETFLDLQRAYFTGDGARRDATASTGSPAASTMSSMSLATASHRRNRERACRASEGSPEAIAVGRVSARHQRPRIYAYVTLRADEEPNEALRAELVQWVRKEISAIAAPDLLQWAPSLRRRAPARSCAASSGRSRRTSPANWAMSRPSPIRPWSRISSATA